MEDRMLLFQIKSELLDMVAGGTTIESYEEWSDAIRHLLDKFFAIKEMDFFIFQEDKCIPIGTSTIESSKITKKPFQNSKEPMVNRDITLYSKRYYPHADDHFLFKDIQTGRSGFLILKSTPEWSSFIKSSAGLELPRIFEQTLIIVGRTLNLHVREESARRLFSMTELFNSTMDSKVILEGIVATVTEAFPQVSVDLLLSHEQKSLSHTFKLLDYMNERTSTMNAFVSGELTVELLEEQAVKILNAPIKGRQGIYGVVQLMAPIDRIFSLAEKEFMTMISSTAGSALENAKLYDQSSHVIKELQLVNETSRKLNDNMQFDEMILFLKLQLLKAFEPDEIAFVFYDEEEKYKVSPISSSFFRTMLSTYYVEYASNYFITEKEALFDANFGDTLKEPVPYESFIAVPITNQENVIGFVTMLHTTNYYFSFDSFKLMRSLISHSSLAFSNSILRDQLQELVDKDHLTKLFTRNYLDRKIKKSLASDDKGVFILMDVDDFKSVNDTFGHAAGDIVLKDISVCILTEVGRKGIAARWGGEEIAIYLPNASDSNGLSFAENLLRRIPEVTDPSVTISIGMKSWSSQNELAFKELFHCTDAALYSAKNNGKNQLVVYGATSSHT